MQEITKIFQKCINKHEIIKEQFRASFKESYEQAPQWQRDVINEEVEKYNEKEQ